LPGSQRQRREKMNRGIPKNDYGEEIIKRGKANPEKLIEDLFVNRKMSAPEYIEIKLLLDINKSLKSLLEEVQLRSL
jgi:hypothetical protein